MARADALKQSGHSQNKNKDLHRDFQVKYLSLQFLLPVAFKILVTSSRFSPELLAVSHDRHQQMEFARLSWSCFSPSLQVAGHGVDISSLSEDCLSSYHHLLKKA